MKACVTVIPCSMCTHVQTHTCTQPTIGFVNPFFIRHLPRVLLPFMDPTTFMKRPFKVQNAGHSVEHTPLSMGWAVALIVGYFPDTKLSGHTACLRDRTSNDRSLSLTVSAVCSPTLAFLPYPSLSLLQPKVEMDSCWQLSPDSTVFLLPGFLPQNNSSFAGKRGGGHTITTKRKQNKERNAKPNQTKQKIKTHHSYPRSLQSKSGPPWHSIWSPWWPNSKLLSGFLCPQYPVSQATPLVILLRLRYFPCPHWL